MTSQISTDAPALLFKDLVEEAVGRQPFSASEDSTAYLVLLLDSFVRIDSRPDRRGSAPLALAELLLSALPRADRGDLSRLRLAGDLALFRAGFQAESLLEERREKRYFLRLGASAYGTLSQYSTVPTAATLFGELADGFPFFVEVLGEVAEHCSLRDDKDLLRLYARWQRTRSQRAAERLQAHGIALGGPADNVH